MAAAPQDQRIAAFRAFNRFFTRRIGVLREGLLDSPYSLTEVRILYELATHDDLQASDLARDLGLDQGYVSRILTRFDKDGMVVKVRSDTDGRARVLRLTPHGRAVFAPLDQRSREEVGALLAAMPDDAQRRMLAAMETVREVLGERDDVQPAGQIVLRPHQPGDMGWIVHRHGAIYAQENGWDERFEGLVAQICADFLNNFDARRERCWIAEMDGEFAGCVALVRTADDAVARLRLLLLEAKARGHGLGRRLVEECIRFARRSGYARIVLSTISTQVQARDIYRKFGFALTASEPSHSFGHQLVNETWELAL